MPEPAMMSAAIVSSILLMARRETRLPAVWGTGSLM
jgi:hypothetical protein